MLKKLIDTNIFIDRFLNPDLYKDIFLSEGLVYLSSIVLMERMRGRWFKVNFRVEARSALDSQQHFYPFSIIYL